MSTRLLLLALALPLAACGGDEAETATDTTAPAADAPMATEPMTEPGATTDPMASDVTVDGTIAAAGTDLTALAPAAAIQNIDGWIAKLEGDQFSELRLDLERLKAQLSTTPLDGAAIGATLTELGEATTASAAGASSSSQEGLRTLGGALSSTGARLTGGSAM
ncbi:MAG TPA: hypothetical protein VF594_04475 [Rubricoccaceae bacterium]|jgi:ABC-type glycerol-3-phosphate transport system substrate-binding protein